MNYIKRLRIKYKKKEEIISITYTYFFKYIETLLQKLMFQRSWKQLAELKLWIFNFCILKSVGHPVVRQYSHELITHLEKKIKSYLVKMYAICKKNPKLLMTSGIILQTLQRSQKSLPPHSFYLSHSWSVVLWVSLLFSIQKKNTLKTAFMHYIIPGTTQWHSTMGK